MDQTVMVYGSQHVYVHMSMQGRDDGGRFNEKVRDQDILKAFDYEATAGEPYLSAGEVTEALARHWEIRVSTETVRTRLERMIEDEKIARREFGAGVAYKALVGPRLAADRVEKSDERRATDHDEFVEL